MSDVRAPPSVSGLPLFRGGRLENERLVPYDAIVGPWFTVSSPGRKDLDTTWKSRRSIAKRHPGG